MHHPAFIVITTLAGILALVAAMFIGTYFLEKNRCEVIAAQMNLEHRFGWLEGCMIRPASGWVPLKNYRVL